MKVCLISNYASHYREEIYRLIDDELHCDFVFGDTLNNGIKSFDFLDFKGDVSILKNFQNGEITVWQNGVLKYLFQKYDAYIVSDDIRCLSTWVFMFFSRLLGKKVYYWAHGWYGRESTVKVFLKKIFYRLPKGVFLYGNYARKIMIDKGLPSDRLWVIHNSLSYSVQSSIRKKIHKTDIYRNYFSNTDPTLIFIGRLTTSKKLDMIIKAMRIMSEMSVFSNLVIVGGGPAYDELNRCAIENGLEDRIWMYGPCYDEEQNAELIYNADVCVSPGNIGLTAIHVMTYGTPAITHNDFKCQGPEFEAIRPGVTGDFYQYENIQSLSDTISGWLENAVNRREDIRQACLEEVDSRWNPEFQMGIIKEHLL